MALLTAALLAGCSAPPLPSLPATRTAPTPAAASPAPSPSPAPLTNATPAIVLELPAAGPTPSPTPPDVALPPERLSILEPGPGSQVTSPVRVVGWGGPAWQQLVHLRLLGEDGGLLAERWTYIQNLPQVPGRFAAELRFDIPGVAESARLEASVASPRDGQLDHLTSVNVVVLSVGSPRLYPAPQGAEKLAILAPRPNAAIQGGRLRVSGAGWLDTPGPLTVEIHDRQGKLAGSASAALLSPGIGQLGTFEADVAYHVDFPQYGRLLVYEPAIDIPGKIHLTSIEVYLEP